MKGTAAHLLKPYSRAWFTAEAQLRRYRHRHTAASSQGLQTSVFITLALALAAATFVLDIRNRLTNPYLTSLIGYCILLFVMAFYLPIVTSIKLGPVSLEKKPSEIAPEQGAGGLAGVPEPPKQAPEPIPIPDSLDPSVDLWTADLMGDERFKQVPLAGPEERNPAASGPGQASPPVPPDSQTPAPATPPAAQSQPAA